MSAYAKAADLLVGRMLIRRRGMRTAREMVEAEGHRVMVVDLVQVVVAN